LTWYNIAGGKKKILIPDWTVHLNNNNDSFPLKWLNDINKENGRHPF